METQLDQVSPSVIALVLSPVSGDGLHRGPQGLGRLRRPLTAVSPLVISGVRCPLSQDSLPVRRTEWRMLVRTKVELSPRPMYEGEIPFLWCVPWGGS